MRPDAITLKQLRGFAAIVRTGGITAAAGALNLTAPAVSTQLRQLETSLGARLVDRGPDGMSRLTPQGEEALSAAVRVESALAGLARRIAAINAGRTGHVALGVVSTGKYFAPALVARARRDMAEVEIGLHVGNRGEIIAALAEGRIDLAIMGRPPREPAVDARVLGPHPHVIIAPPGHPLAGGQAVTPEALLAETFLAREPGSGTRILMERYLDQTGEGRPVSTFELGSNETIKQAVIAGLGIALISAHTVIAELEAGRLALVRAPGLPIVRQWFLIRPAGAAPSPAALRLADFIAAQKDLPPPVAL